MTRANELFATSRATEKELSLIASRHIRRTEASSHRAVSRSRFLFTSGSLWCVVLCAVAMIHHAAHGSESFLLITEHLEAKPIRLIGFDSERLRYSEPGEQRVQTLPLERCIALVKERPPARATTENGLLRLADGRKYPGEPATPRSDAQLRETFGWHSSWLGRLAVPFEEIRSINLRPLDAGGRVDVVALERDDQLREDAVYLTNGDVLSGFIARIGENLVLEVDEGERTIELPLERIAAVRLMTPPRSSAKRPRAWLADGTIMDVRAIEIDGGGMTRIIGGDHSSTGTRLDVRHLAGVLLAPSRMTPLAALDPSEVTGPASRYTIPKPVVLEEDALLGLAPIELRGPIRVNYEVPDGTVRFAAEAVLPEVSRHYGDFELIVSDGERELFRQRITGADPVASIHVPVESGVIVIELVEGPHGAIHNHIILRRAMLGQ